MNLPHLSRFEQQCLRRLGRKGEATVREVHADIPEGPSYSTVRKIFERLEQKEAIARVRLEGKAWVYRCSISPDAIARREVRSLVEGFFDGRGASLVAHLAETDAISLEDLRAVEEILEKSSTRRRRRAPRPPSERRGGGGAR